MTNLDNSSRVVKTIKQKLVNNGVKLFKKTCFGLFLIMKPIIFCGAVVHNLLVRQMECDDPKVIEFNFLGIGLCVHHYDLKIIVIYVWYDTQYLVVPCMYNLFLLSLFCFFDSDTPISFLLHSWQTFHRTEPQLRCHPF